MNVEQLERAQALGFGSVAEMESHEAWLAKTAGPDYLNWVERVKRANGEPAEWQVPCLFECDPITLEATGTVATFCSTVCRSKSMGSIGFAAMAPGVSKLSDFGYTPHCEECDKEIVDFPD